MERATEEIIELTPEAAQKAKDIMQERDMEGHGIRVEIMYSNDTANYNLELSEEPLEEDLVINSNGIKLFVHSESASALEGSKIDWKVQNERKGFTIIEPYESKNKQYDNSLRGRSKEFLDKNFPQIKGHGGEADIEVINENTGHLKVKLEGACSSCGISDQTLKAIRRSLPSEVEGVNRVDVETGNEGTEIEPPV